MTDIHHQEVEKQLAGHGFARVIQARHEKEQWDVWAHPRGILVSFSWSGRPGSSAQARINACAEQDPLGGVHYSAQLTMPFQEVSRRYSQGAAHCYLKLNDVSSEQALTAAFELLKWMPLVEFSQWRDTSLLHAPYWANKPAPKKNLLARLKPDPLAKAGQALLNQDTGLATLLTHLLTDTPLQDGLAVPVHEFKLGQPFYCALQETHALLRLFWPQRSSAEMPKDKQELMAGWLHAALHEKDRLPATVDGWLPTGQTYFSFAANPSVHLNFNLEEEGVRVMGERLFVGRATMEDLAGLNYPLRMLREQLRESSMDGFTRHDADIGQARLIGALDFFLGKRLATKSTNILGALAMHHSTECHRFRPEYGSHVMKVLCERYWDREEVWEPARWKDVPRDKARYNALLHARDEPPQIQWTREQTDEWLDTHWPQLVRPMRARQMRAQLERDVPASNPSRSGPRL